MKDRRSWWELGSVGTIATVLLLCGTLGIDGAKGDLPPVEAAPESSTADDPDLELCRSAVEALDDAYTLASPDVAARRALRLGDMAARLRMPAGVSPPSPDGVQLLSPASMSASRAGEGAAHR